MTAQNPDIVTGPDGLARPAWCSREDFMRDYYDAEWGDPLGGETDCYERLCLEGFQAGLSWRTVLAKREALREHFAGFDPDRVAYFSETDLERIAQDPRVIRSPRKIAAAVNNARATLALRERAAAVRAHGVGFDGANSEDDARLLGFALPLHGGASQLEVEDGLPALLWSYRPESTPVPATQAEVPTASAESAALAKDLKRRGFKFVGPTSAFAMMEAIGIVDTNLVGTYKRGLSGVWA